jgi:hypothetical protein
MLENSIFPAFLLLGAVAFFAAAPPALVSQQPSPPPSPAPAPARPLYSPFREFHVDQECRLLPDPAHPVIGKKKPRLRADPVICHLETVAHSEHMEETIVGDELRRNLVRITEQEYVVQNITTEHVVFVVHQFVPQGWNVDSDPQPAEVKGQTAIFRVHADAGQIVRLHVGLRHTSPLRSKLIKASQ